MSPATGSSRELDFSFETAASPPLFVKTMLTVFAMFWLLVPTHIILWESWATLDAIAPS